MQDIGKLNRALLPSSNNRYKHHRPHPSGIDDFIVCQLHWNTFGGIVAYPVVMGGHMSSGPSVCIPMDVSIKLERV